MERYTTRDRWRSRLPHWEVEGHWHFVTIRCQGSLPEAAKRRLQEINRTLQSIEAQSEAFYQLQRRYFLTTEKYLDAGSGFAPFTQPRPNQLCLEAMIAMEKEGWLVGEATVMPNHVHLLILEQDTGFSLKQIVERFKGRSARWINQALGRSERFWQQDWFDRWIRNEGELAKTIAYIRNNPVKAKLASDWKAYQWRISHEEERNT
ncbi:MAG: hypothetical protein EA353_07640 [Puniceicoccaceae bacterium]|nr:MAG: hypothetical protein EA353_07640 [Puniceicoccaceae bacterium]